MNKYHQKLERTFGLPYALYNNHKPPRYQMVNGMWHKVEKGVPCKLLDDCVRKQLKLKKQANKANGELQ